MSSPARILLPMVSAVTLVLMDIQVKFMATNNAFKLAGEVGRSCETS